MVKGPAMWRRANGKRYDHRGSRYESDLTDGEWPLLAPNEV